MISDVAKTIGMLPDERRELYLSKGVSLINANKLIQNKPLSDYLNSLISLDIDFKVASNLLLGDISAYLNRTEKSIDETTLTKERFSDLVSKVSSGTLTSKNLKEILYKVLEEESSISDIMQEMHIENITDDKAIRELIQRIIKENPTTVADYKAGHDRALKFFMGQVMKETKGSANPQLAMSILQEELH